MSTRENEKPGKSLIPIAAIRGPIMNDEYQEPAPKGTTRRDVIMRGGPTRNETLIAEQWMGKTIQYEPGKFGVVVDMTEDKLILRAQIVVPKGYLLVPTEDG